MKQYLMAIGIGLIIAGLLFLAYKHQQKTDTNTTSRSLKPDVQEKLIIDPSHHSLVIVTPTDTKVTTLPNRPSSIEVLKSGKLRLTVPQYGYELSPFIGIGYSNQLNDYIGCDFFYWKRLDIGTAFSFDRDLKVKSLGFPVVVSYMFYHNVRLSIGLEPFGSHAVHGLISVKL